MKTLKLLLSFTVLSIAMLSCKPTDPIGPHEEELITTLNLELEADGSTKTLNFQDVDGDGGDAPVITTDTLAANTIYAGSITLFNESVDPREELTAEIFNEAEEHQFFFATTGSSSFSYTDQDNNGNPVGLSFELTTGDAGSESYTIILRHLPEKTALGVSNGEITNAGGETDIEIVFDVIIE